MRKYALGSFYFSKAIEANERETGRKGKPPPGHKPLNTVVSDRLFELLYNQGLALLHMSRPCRAHECFQAGLLFTAHKPYVWLRMAECCIQEHWQQRTCPGGASDFPAARLVGAAQNRKFVLLPRFSK